MQLLPHHVNYDFVSVYSIKKVHLEIYVKLMSVSIAQNKQIKREKRRNSSS